MKKFCGTLLAVLLSGLFFAGACSSSEPGGMQSLSRYGDALHTPLEDRISLGHKALLDWQHKINRDYGQDIRPRRAAPGNPLVPLVHKVVAELPAQVRQLATRYLVALYLLEDDFGTGTTEAIHDAEGNWRYAYIALNLTALTRSANAWGSWKEASAFRPGPGHAIRMVLEETAQDDREGAIRFIFLHELGHVLGLALGAHGFWDAETLPPATSRSPFVAISWMENSKGEMASRWRKTYPELDNLPFYRFGKSSLGISTAEGKYRALAATDFPSLYGTINVFDDFAETFAIYVHTRLLGKPYRVEIMRREERRFVYRSCVATGGCAKKVSALKALLGWR